MNRLALVWRLARRGTVLSRAQAVLIVVLVALPVLGYAGVALVIDSRSATDAETLTAMLGQTESRVQHVSTPDPSLRQTPPGSDQWTIAYDTKGNPVHEPAREVPLASALPAGTQVLRLADTTIEADSAAGVADISATVGPVWNPSLRGRFSVTAGHAPRDDHEIMATSAALTRLGAQLGDAVHLRSPISGDYTITGLIADTRVNRSTPELFLADGALAGTSAAPTADSYAYYLPTLNVDAAQAKTLNHAGYIVISRALAARYGIRGWNSIQSSGGELWLILGLALVFGAFEVILLAGSAFFIGAKQRQRVLAIIASSGGSRGILVGIVTLTGAALGLVGGILGSAAGIGAGSLYLRLTADGSAAHYPGYHFVWWVYAVMALVAGAIGFCAAVVPAVAVSRLDVVGALRGATRPVAARRRRPIIGAIVAIAGAAIALGCGLLAAFVAGDGFGSPDGHNIVSDHSARIMTVLYYGVTGGVIIMQLGLILMASLVLAAVSAGLRRLGVASRLASRDLARNRSRAVPAIASIMTTTFLAVFLMGLIASEDAANSARYTWDISEQQVAAYLVSGASPSETLSAHTAELESALGRTLPIAKPTVISGVPAPSTAAGTDDADDPKLYPVPLASESARCPVISQGYIEASSDSSDWRCNDLVANYAMMNDDAPLIVVGGVPALTQILGHTPSAAAVSALASGGAVSLHRAFVADGRMTIAWYSAQGRDDLMHPATLAAPEKSTAVAAVYEKSPHPLSFGVVLSPQAAQRLGITAVPTTILASLTATPTQDQQDALRAALDAINAGAQDAFGASVQLGPTPTSPIYFWGALAASSLIALAAAVVALSLARQDGARDGAVFDAIGASPRMRRSLAFWQALIVVGSGAILGALTATLTVYSAFGLAPGQVFAMPWLQVAVGTLGLSAAIAGGAWVVGGRRTVEQLGRAAIA